MKKKSNQFIIFIIILCVIIEAIGILYFFDERLTPPLLNIAKQNLEKEIYKIASDFKGYSSFHLNQINLADTFQNSQGEITSIDYDMDQVYELSQNFTNHIQKKLLESETISSLVYETNKGKTNINQGIVVYIPLGMVTGSVFLANLGPKIPIVIHFIDSVFTQVKTKVTDYGINNALIEIYLNVNINYEIIGPTKQEEQTVSYDLLLDTKIIQGTVPQWYGRSFESRSSFCEIQSIQNKKLKTTIYK